MDRCRCARVCTYIHVYTHAISKVSGFLRVHHVCSHPFGFVCYTRFLSTPLPCPAITAATMAEPSKTVSNASAEQPGSAHLPLLMLNKASVKTGGTWDGVCWNSFEDKYEYAWQGKRRQGTNLLCNLVSSDDPRSYCLAQFKKRQRLQQSIRGKRTTPTCKQQVFLCCQDL